MLGYTNFIRCRIKYVPICYKLDKIYEVYVIAKPTTYLNADIYFIQINYV